MHSDPIRCKYHNIVAAVMFLAIESETFLVPRTLYNGSNLRAACSCNQRTSVSICLTLLSPFSFNYSPRRRCIKVHADFGPILTYVS